MPQTNTVQCPKCEQDANYLASVQNGKQHVCCKNCGNVFQAEVKQGQFTGNTI